MGGLNLAQDQRRMAQDARERVIEIQRHRAGQLQSAVQLLLVCQAGFTERRLSIRRRGGALAQ